MDDEANVGVYPHRPEIRILGTIKFMKRQAGRGGIHLQIEGSRLHRLLLLRRQPCEAIGKGIGNPEFHQRWLSISASSNSALEIDFALHRFCLSKSELR